MMTCILIIEDDVRVATSTERWLSMEGFEVKICHDSTQSMALLEQHNIDVILSDVRMPKVTGMELLPKIVAFDVNLPVILMTGHGDISMAVDAMEKGAYYFIEKPFEPEHLTQIINRAVEKRKLATENQRLKNQLSQVSGIESTLIGSSTVMNKLRKQLLMLAGFDASIIINGDTGTGKELVARCLHDYSARFEQPFVAINCGAIPENLLESELFGHEKGAFTGANQTRIGKLEYASNGTLFLDEVESMPMNFQVKLLRALQEKTIERVGSNKSISINPRIISATKVDLKALAEQGDFRLDLYYRLKVAELYLPKLQERLDDIPLLFQHFINIACQQYQLPEVKMTVENLVLLSKQTWPGNVRELANLAQQFAIANISGDIPLATLLTPGYVVDPEATVSGSGANNLLDQVSNFEEQLIRASMSKHQGSIKDIMTELQVSRRTLNIKMQRYNIQRNDYL